MKNLLSFDAYTLKLIAVVGMISNHIAIGLHEVLPLPVLLPLFAAGGLTYIIMAYFVVEGYKHTSNFKKYISRLLIFGLIAQAFHPMVLGITAMLPGPFLNILFTITLSLIVLYLYDKIKVRFLFWLLFAVACVLAMFMDLSFMGIVVSVMYYAIKKEGRRRALPGIIFGSFFLLFGLLSTGSLLMLKNMPGMEAEFQYAVANTGMTMDLLLATPTFAIGCFLGAILIKNYNGERGKPAKWLFYVTYPVHLAVIAMVGVALGVIEFSLFGL